MTLGKGGLQVLLTKNMFLDKPVAVPFHTPLLQCQLLLVGVPFSSLQTNSFIELRKRVNLRQSCDITYDKL